MLTQQFVEWCKTANVADRCYGVALLADAVTERKFLPAETRQAEASLLIALDDPSPRVRETVARYVAGSDRVPRELVRRLVADIDDVALPVVAASPLLEGNDLVALAAGGRAALRSAVARRPELETRVCAALLGADADICLELLENHTAAVGDDGLRRLATLWGDDARLRDALLRRDDLPTDARHQLLGRLANDLCASPFVANIVGASRALALEGELRERATAALVELLDAPDLPSFVEYLRDAGQLHTALLIRAVCGGRIDFFAAAVSRLSGMPERRVHAVIADAHEPAFHALMSVSGVSPPAIPLLLSAVRVWKNMANGPEIANEAMAAAVVERVSLRFRDDAEYDGLTRLLYRLGLETQATLARRRAGRHLAA